MSSIKHREYGRGNRILLLHDLGGTPKQWRHVIAALSAHFCVTVLDLSSLFVSANGLSFENMVNTVEDYCVANFLNEELVVGGQGFGGGIAWGLACRGNLKISKVDLFNPLVPCRIDDFVLPEFRYFFMMMVQQSSVVRLLGTPIGQSLLKRGSSYFAMKPKARVRPSRYMRVAKQLVHVTHILRSEEWVEWEAKLAALTVPVSVSWSARDMFLKPEAYVNFASRLPNARVVRYEDGGHLFVLEKPTETIAALAAPANNAKAA